MSRLPDHLSPPAIKISIVRLYCEDCGTETDAKCNCGKPYMPKAERVARANEYAEQHPSASVRQIAAASGASVGTAHKAKARVRDEHLDATVTGRDGKSYPATKPQPDSNGPPPDLIGQAQKHLDRIVPLLRQMDQRERLSFRAAALKQMADAHLDVTEF